MSENETPFVVGAQVAVDLGRFRDLGVRIDTVARVHKSGRFTLNSDPKQQWRPFRPGTLDEGKWTARMSGEGNWDGRLTLWNEASDAEIKKRLAESSRRARWSAIQSRIARMTPPETDSVINTIEFALKANDSPPPLPARSSTSEREDVA